MWDIGNERAGSEEFDGSTSRIPIRKSEIIVRIQFTQEHQQHTPSTHYNQTSGSNTARERSASKPRISRPSSTLKEHHQQQYGNNSHSHSKSGGNSQRGSTYLSSSMSQSSYKWVRSENRKKPNYGASGTAVSGVANNPPSGRTSAQYNYSRAKKSALWMSVILGLLCYNWTLIIITDGLGHTHSWTSHGLPGRLASPNPRCLRTTT